MQQPKVRNRIGRSIYETHCTGSYFDSENRKVVQFNEVLNGNIKTVERAAKILKRKMQVTQLIVEEIHHFKTYVSAPLDKFIDICDERTEKEID